MIRAVDTAHQIGMRTIALTGSGGRQRELTLACLSVPSTDTQYSHEVHLAFEHILCEPVERALFSPSSAETTTFGR